MGADSGRNRGAPSAQTRPSTHGISQGPSASSHQLRGPVSYSAGQAQMSTQASLKALVIRRSLFAGSLQSLAYHEELQLVSKGNKRGGCLSVCCACFILGQDDSVFSSVYHQQETMSSKMCNARPLFSLHSGSSWREALLKGSWGARSGNAPHRTRSSSERLPSLRKICAYIVSQEQVYGRSDICKGSFKVI